MRPRARRIQYRGLPCKTLINRVPGDMPFRWSINPYRGCTHGCVYCYARATHPYLGLDGGVDFESVIFVKQGAVEALRRDLSRPGWNRELVAIGTATDPYQPIEGKYRLMRGILRALIDAETPFSITTKSTLVLRDLDLLVEASHRAGCTVNVSVPTVDPALWRQLEPGTPHPVQRLRVLQRLRQAGVRPGSCRGAGWPRAHPFPGSRLPAHLRRRDLRFPARRGRATASGAAPPPGIRCSGPCAPRLVEPERS